MARIYFKIIGFVIAALAFSTVSTAQHGDNRFKISGLGIDTLLKDKNKHEYLEMRGIVHQSRKTEKGSDTPLDSAVITIYSLVNKSQNKLVTLYTNKRGKCYFRLPLDEKFLITIAKRGFVSKSILIDTKTPEHKKAVFLFPFSVDIFEDVKGLDVSMLKKPVADIAYAFSKDNFDYDLVYTNKVRNDLATMYKNFFLLKKIQQDTLPSLPAIKDTTTKH